MNNGKIIAEKELRSFAIGLAVILTLIASVQFLKSKAVFPYLAAAGIVAFIIAFFFPVKIKPVYMLFSRLGYCMGWLMTRIILAVLFFFVFTVMGLSMRLFGKRFLNIKFPQHPQSLWITAENKDTNFEEQF